RPEPNVGPSGVGFADHLQRGDGRTSPVLLVVLLPVAHYGDLQPLGERVDHREPDAVQAARDLVATPTELSTGVELGHDNLERRLALVLHDVDRDAAAVVGDRRRAVLVERYLDACAEARQGLVNGVVDELVDEVVETPVIGGPDVHSGTASDRLQTLQNLDDFGVIGRRRFFFRIQQIAYSNYTQCGRQNRRFWALRVGPRGGWLGPVPRRGCRRSGGDDRSRLLHRRPPAQVELSRGADFVEAPHRGVVRRGLDDL